MSAQMDRIKRMVQDYFGDLTMERQDQIGELEELVHDCEILIECLQSDEDD